MQLYQILVLMLTATNGQKLYYESWYKQQHQQQHQQQQQQQQQLLVVGKGAHEDVAAKDEAAEKRELNADALVVIEEVKKDALVEVEKDAKENV
jgi:hypothetical protein